MQSCQVCEGQTLLYQLYLLLLVWTYLLYGGGCVVLDELLFVVGVVGGVSGASVVVMGGVVAGVGCCQDSDLSSSAPFLQAWSSSCLSLA